MELSDREYVQRCRDGFPDDFRLLIERYQRPLFAYCSGRLGNALEAEEAAQESFVRAFLGLKTLRNPESFYAWLIGIAGRVLKERFRSQERRQRDRVLAESLLTSEEDPQPEYPLEEALAALPEGYRQVIVLRYYEGLSCQEVATRLRQPLGTVTKTLSRAYALLREQLRSRDGLQVNHGTHHELR